MINTEIISFTWELVVDCLKRWWWTSIVLILSLRIRSATTLQRETRMSICWKVVSVRTQHFTKFNKVIPFRILFGLAVLPGTLSWTLNSTCIFWKVSLNLDDLLFISVRRVKSQFLRGQLQLILLLDLFSPKQIFCTCITALDLSRFWSYIWVYSSMLGFVWGRSFEFDFVADVVERGVDRTIGLGFFVWGFSIGWWVLASVWSEKNFLNSWDLGF